MGNQLWLPDVVADAFRGVKGYRVEVMSGWSSRGRTNFAPIGVMNHHTGRGGYEALLNYMAHGSSISPLCNIATSRPEGGVVRITIVEAGKANHAGRGYLPWTGKDGGNYRTIGIENQNDGAQPWPTQQVEGIHILSAALLKQLGVGTDRLVDHKTYTSRKPDRHSVNINDTRRAVDIILEGGPVSRNYIVPGDNGPDVKSWQQDLQRWNPKALPKFGPDGDFGDETTLWTNKFMVETGLVSAPVDDPAVGPKTRQKMAEVLASGTTAPTPSPKKPDYKVVVLFGKDAPLDQGMALLYADDHDLKPLSWPNTGGATFETAFLVGDVAKQAGKVRRYIENNGFKPNVVKLAGGDRYATAAAVSASSDQGYRKHPGVNY